MSRGAASCSVSRIAFRPIGSSCRASVPRRIGRLRASGAGQSVGLRRHVRGGAPRRSLPQRLRGGLAAVLARHCSIRRSCASRGFSFRGPRMDRSSTQFVSVVRLRCPATRAVCRGTHATDSPVVALRSGPALGRSISSYGRRLVEGAAIRRPSLTGAGRARGGSHRDRGGRCAPSGCAACQRPATPRRCSQGRRCGPRAVSLRSPDGLSGGCSGAPSNGCRFQAI